MKKLMDDPENIVEAYKHVRRWTKHVDLFSKDFVFVPVNEHLHWALIVLYRPGAFLKTQLKKLGLPDEDEDASGAAATAEHAEDDDDTDEDDPDEPEDDGRENARRDSDEAAGGNVSGEGELEPDEDDVEDLPDSESHAMTPAASAVLESQEEAEVDADVEASVEADDDYDGRGVQTPGGLRGDGGDGANPIELDDDDDDGAAPAPSQPCMLYIDSMNNTKQKACQLLKAYLHLEYREKKSKKEAARLSAPAPDPNPLPLAGRKRSRSSAAVPGGEDDDGAGVEDAGEMRASQASKSSDTPQEVGFKRGRGFNRDALLSEDEDLMGASTPEQALHLFRDYGHERVEVEFQHNGHDCGLYMLEYVRRLAQHQTDLTAAKRRGRNGGMHWNDHEVLRFTSDEIDSLREQMQFDIKNHEREKKKREAQDLDAS